MAKSKAKQITTFIVNIDQDYPNVDRFKGGGVTFLIDDANRGEASGAKYGWFPTKCAFTRHLTACKGWRMLCKDRATMAKPHDITIRYMSDDDGVTVENTVQLLQCKIISLDYETETNPRTGNPRVLEVLTLQPESIKY